LFIPFNSGRAKCQHCGKSFDYEEASDPVAQLPKIVTPEVSV
jgi:hypothetical protein